jgi:predicted dehydrogenase/threonine dehydrogenase-like Zn-dependent dehydrogenase
VKQVLQSLRNGTIEVASVPAPAAQRGNLLIASSRTLISAGTERMLVDFGKASFIDKMRQHPDKVRLVMEKVKTDGLLTTLQAVRNKLDQPLAMGYSNAGVVLAVGDGVTGFAVGDRVASNGKHAEVVNVPANLCAKVPDSVADDEAAFTVLAAVALQGIRLVQPTLGEAVVVTGLGVIGLLTVQLLRAHGCRVMAVDFDDARLELARRMGAEVVRLAVGESPVDAARSFSRGRGVDAVIIAASTRSSDPVHQAASMCRKRGRIVLVGVAGLDLRRDDFYEKELTFQVSCSYGPGRYDSRYEHEGHDYPVGYVRWTEQRNFEAVLDMMASGRLDVKPLVSHRFAIESADRAYAALTDDRSALGILIEYPQRAAAPPAHRNVRLAPLSPAAERPVVSFIGAGNYATGVLLPAFRATGVKLRSVASRAGVSGLHAARKFGFEETTTDTDAVLADAATSAVVITTRHDSHAELVVRALQSGKHVFVEKPLCLTREELSTIEHAFRASGRQLMVGFNRRFSPHVRRMAALLSGMKQPKVFIITVNAGAVPRDHWTQDPALGGGRILGEACHFIDLLRHLAGCAVRSVHAVAAIETPDAPARNDNATITLQFEDGSSGTIHYVAVGHKRFPKERLEVFVGGRILQLDNFRTLTAYGWPGFTRMKTWRQDKGQQACVAAFIDGIEKGGAAPIAFEELAEVSRIAIEAAERVT